MKPIRKLLGEFEAWVLTYGSRHTAENYDYTLERLFAMYPRKHRPEQFDRMDVMDYLQARREKGIAESTLRLEQACIRAFWAWLINKKGLRLVNPASVGRTFL